MWTFSFQFSSVSQSCPSLCNPMACGTPGLSVHHQQWFKDVERETRRLKMTHSLSWRMFRPGNKLGLLKSTLYTLCHQLVSCSNSCPSSQWWHPTISPSAVPFSSHTESFPASESSHERLSSFYQVAKLSNIQLQHQPFQWIFKTDFL